MNNNTSPLKVNVNESEEFYVPRDKYSDDASQKVLKKIFESQSSLFISNNEKENSEYKNINTITFRNNSNIYEKKLVYEVRKETIDKAKYYIQTGLYIGYIGTKNWRLEIGTGYEEQDNHFLNRMLDVANNIYFDSKEEHVSKKDDKDPDLISLILTYLFITNLRTAISMGLPIQYNRRVERGFNVKGRINIKEYISKDMLFGSKLTYSYNQLEPVQEIVDVLCLTIKTLKDNGSVLDQDIIGYYNKLKVLYSGRKPTRAIINRILNHKALNNPMYGKYKKALQYACYILENKNIIYDDNDDSKSVSGFLLDISELWEVYIANLLQTENLIDHDSSQFYVDSQRKLDLYKGTFFSRPNYPDIVLESEKSIAVLDAKFKKMRFQYNDVDRNDLFQINSYAGYFRALQEKAAKNDRKTVRLCSLVYPYSGEKNEIPEEEKIKCGLYGFEYPDKVSTLFSIEYIDIGKDKEELLKNEKEFVERIRRILQQ